MAASVIRQLLILGSLLVGDKSAASDRFENQKITTLLIECM